MHDMNGTPLGVGDRITVEYEIMDIQPGLDFCNMTARSVSGRKPDGAHENICCNSAIAVLQRRAAPK